MGHPVSSLFAPSELSMAKPHRIRALLVYLVFTRPSRLAMDNRLRINGLDRSLVLIYRSQLSALPRGL